MNKEVVNCVVHASFSLRPGDLIALEKMGVIKYCKECLVKGRREFLPVKICSVLNNDGLASESQVICEQTKCDNIIK